ncbi:hypothetical protein MVES1_000210 [Malassezia vespertilionis]|uniref:uncharacterized protein n=1 Tax=Malassezia vespertilionis TaxID=2020962 RepID=UPI0024B0D123|nr:uncharacterized protein MVES1_000210 [Malassezia vespertilionis]WFD04885.1 hypothetical protein MVES1_000210 [Malassezia vespertilionis]
MPIQTQLTEALGLRAPLVMGGMQYVGKPALAAAVSNAGGLGVITALTQPSPEALKDAINEANSLLDPAIVAERPKYGAIGVNITLLPAIMPPDYGAYVRAAIDAGVRIFETAGNNPGDIIKMAKDAGAYVIHKCTSVRHGKTAVRLGADMLSIDGFECAGHPGEDDVGGLILLAIAAEQLSVPFIASGGIANGQGLAAVLMLGAQGANMGTRFMATKESDIHDNIKQVILQSGERDTVHILRTLHNTARVFKNSVTKEIVQKEDRGVDFQEILPLVAGTRGRKVYELGDPDAGVWTAGLTVALIHDIPTCKELVGRMLADAESQICGMAAKISPKPHL